MDTCAFQCPLFLQDCFESIFFFQRGEVDYKSELQQLEKEGEIPLDELLASLPPEILEQHKRAGGSTVEEQDTVSKGDTASEKAEIGSSRGKSSTRSTRYYSK